MLKVTIFILGHGEEWLDPVPGAELAALPDRRHDEWSRWSFLMLGAGSESTTHLISGSVYELVKNPTLRNWLENPSARNSRL
jgi:hypothetical protein